MVAGLNQREESWKKKKGNEKKKLMKKNIREFHGVGGFEWGIVVLPFWFVFILGKITISIRKFGLGDESRGRESESFV